MTQSQSQLTELLYPGLKEIYDDTQKKYTYTWDRFLDVVRSVKRSDDYVGMTGLGLVPSTANGANLTFDQIYQGYKKTFTNLTYKLGVEIPREDIEDDLYNILNRIPEFMALAVSQTVDSQATLILDRAFSGSYLGADGVSLCSTAHPLVAGGTFANRSASDANLSMTAIQNAFIDIRNFKNERGQPMNAMPKKLIVAPAFEATAKRLMMSDTDPETSSRSINPFSQSMEIVVDNRLADSDAFFIRTDQKGLIAQMRNWPAEFAKDNSFNTGNAKFSVYFRLTMGFYDGRAIWGSAGA